MLATQRHNQIQVLLQQHGAVSVSQLMETFGISILDSHSGEGIGGTGNESTQPTGWVLSDCQKPQ